MYKATIHTDKPDEIRVSTQSERSEIHISKTPSPGGIKEVKVESHDPFVVKIPDNGSTKEIKATRV